MELSRVLVATEVSLDPSWSFSCGSYFSWQDLNCHTYNPTAILLAKIGQLQNCGAVVLQKLGTLCKIQFSSDFWVAWLACEIVPNFILFPLVFAFWHQTVPKQINKDIHWYPQCGANVFFSLPVALKKFTVIFWSQMLVSLVCDAYHIRIRVFLL